MNGGRSLLQDPVRIGKLREAIALSRSAEKRDGVVEVDGAYFSGYVKPENKKADRAYSPDGACTNMVESFFSRLRRAEIGTHHHIAGKYLAAYASEMAWREDNRRVSNGGQFAQIVAAAMEAPVSRQWKGYWQRRAA